jgi:hypothetical protein
MKGIPTGMAFPVSAENKATFARPRSASDRGSLYSDHVRAACVVHVANPPQIGEGSMLSGRGHRSHEKSPLRDVLMFSPVENPWRRVWKLGRESSKFFKGVVGATGIEPVTPPV